MNTTAYCNKIINRKVKKNEENRLKMFKLNI